ncbi:MAG: hypothetical protein ABEJ68_11830 [Halobacteriaceae archaeon]
MTEPSDSDDQPIACTLDGEEMADREVWIEDALAPHLCGVDERDDGYAFVFERTPAAYEAVTELAWREADCCAWATIAVELPPAGEEIRWRITSDRADGAAFLDDALVAAAERIDGLAH